MPARLPALLAAPPPAPAPLWLTNARLLDGTGAPPREGASVLEGLVLAATGNGTLHRGLEEAALRAQVEALGLAGRVTWAGALDQPAVRAHYRANDLFVLASEIAPDGDRDGLPNVVVEALSQGLPVVATRAAAIPEVVLDGIQGRLAPPGDPEALAGPGPLIDVHAHFFFDGCGRGDWDALNRARFRGGDRIGVSFHVASILGSWGRWSPTYFASPADTTTCAHPASPSARATRASSVSPPSSIKALCATPA